VNIGAGVGEVVIFWLQALLAAGHGDDLVPAG
jgi:hypothetical protein